MPRAHQSKAHENTQVLIIVYDQDAQLTRIRSVRRTCRGGLRRIGVGAGKPLFMTFPRKGNFQGRVERRRDLLRLRFQISEKIIGMGWVVMGEIDAPYARGGGNSGDGGVSPVAPVL